MSNSATLWTVTLQAPRPWDSPGKNARVGCHVLLQVTFPTQGLNPRFCIAGGFLTAESPGQSMAAGVGPRQGSKSY